MPNKKGLMSLSSQQRAITRTELQTNLELSGLSRTELEQKLGLDAHRVSDALQVADAEPADVWLLRDYLERVIQARGGIPHPYSYLTAEMRAAAERWFPLRNVDDVLRAAKQASTP